MASGNQHQIQYLIDRGLFEVLPSIMNSRHSKVFEQGAWIIGNISADVTLFRRKLIDLGMIHPLAQRIIHSDDFNEVQSTSWALTNLVRGSTIDKKKEKEALVPLMKVVVNFDDAEMLTNCLAALCDIMSSDYIDLLIQAGLPRRLYIIASRGVTNHLYSICQILSHISFGSAQQTDVIIQEGFLEILFNILKSSVYTAQFKKEVLWTISNITIGEIDHIHAVLSNEDRLVTLMTLCRHDNRAVRKEAIWSVCNVTSKGRTQEKEMLLRNGVLQMFSFNLQMDSDVDVIKTILEALKNLLNLEDHELNSNSDHPLFFHCQEAGIFDKLEGLLEHHVHNVYTRALEIIELYFETEDNLF